MRICDHEGYGMTETTGAITRSSVELGAEEPDATVGKVTPYMEIKVTYIAMFACCIFLILML
jgi:long-subunit acyl-CoA synthetase (AMP-forming)